MNNSNRKQKDRPHVHKIDLNCDMGEAFGAYSFGNDMGILDYITSANIACGFHAGDPMTMADTVKKGLEKGVRIGAHPGFRDLVGFGRRKIEMPATEIYHDVLYQLGALDAFCRPQGTKINHVKPHGALYNMAAKDHSVADAIARAVADFDPNVVLVGLSGSELIAAGHANGLTTASEVFADRTYQPDGTLTPRSHTNAMIDSEAEAARRVIRMITEGKVTAVDSTDININADTVCVHGDGPNVLAFLKRLRETLQEAGVRIQSLG